MKCPNCGSSDVAPIVRYRDRGRHLCRKCGKDFKVKEEKQPVAVKVS